MAAATYRHHYYSHYYYHFLGRNYTQETVFAEKYFPHFGEKMFLGKIVSLEKVRARIVGQTSSKKQQ